MIPPDDIAFIRAHRRTVWAIRLTTAATAIGTLVGLAQHVRIV